MYGRGEANGVDVLHASTYIASRQSAETFWHIRNYLSQRPVLIFTEKTPKPRRNVKLSQKRYKIIFVIYLNSRTLHSISKISSSSTIRCDTDAQSCATSTNEGPQPKID